MIEPVATKTRRAGVAMFSAIFVMIIVGLLAMQFHYMSRQAQSSAHRFQTSEMARQLAASAMEEAFMYVFRQSDNPASPFIQKLVKRSSDIDASSTSLENKNNKGVTVPTDLTLAQAANMPMGSRIKINATARIIDFRKNDTTGAAYFENEGIGTLELRVTAEPKDEFKKQMQGACTITRHHDYKVAAIVARRDNTTQRTSYAGAYALDYAVFLRDGQEEFDSTAGLSLNPVKQKLTIDQTGLAPGEMGKIYLGNRRSKSVYYNIDTARQDFIPTPHKKEKILQVDDQTVFKLLPQFFNQVKAQANKAVKDKGASMKGFSMSGHSAYFEYQRHPVTDEALSSITDLKDFRDATLVGEAKHKGQKVTTEIFPALTIKPDNALTDILEGDLRQRYFHFGYFYVDMTNCKIWVKAKKSGESKSETIEITDPSLIGSFKNKKIPCFDADHFEGVTDNSIDLRYIKENIAGTYPEVICRIDESNRYLKGSNTTLAHPAMFQFRSSGSIDDPTMASVPFAHTSLWSRRNLTAAQLVEFGIYQPAQKKLKLQGIMQFNEAITLGSDGDIEVEGRGVLIAPGITINGGIKKKPGTDSICVLLTRGYPITVNTDKTIEAALISMGRSDRNGYVTASKKLDLVGCLAVDRLNIAKWAENVEHKIQYDPAFKRNESLYQVSVNRWVTFERMVEQDE